MAEIDLIGLGFAEAHYVRVACETKRGKERFVVQACDQEGNELPEIRYFQKQIPFFTIIGETTLVMIQGRLWYKKGRVYVSNHGIPRRLYVHTQ